MQNTLLNGFTWQQWYTWRWCKPFSREISTIKINKHAEKYLHIYIYLNKCIKNHQEISRVPKKSSPVMSIWDNNDCFRQSTPTPLSKTPCHPELTLAWQRLHGLPTTRQAQSETCCLSFSLFWRCPNKVTLTLYESPRAQIYAINGTDSDPSHSAPVFPSRAG